MPMWTEFFGKDLNLLLKNTKLNYIIQKEKLLYEKENV